MSNVGFGPLRTARAVVNSGQNYYTLYALSDVRSPQLIRVVYISMSDLVIC